MKSTTCFAVAFAVAVALFAIPLAVHATPVSQQEPSVEHALMGLVSQVMDRMMASDQLNRELARGGADAIPGIAVASGAISNRSMHQFAGEFLTDTIRSKLVATGRFHVVVPPSAALQPIDLSAVDMDSQFLDINQVSAPNYWLSGTIDEFRVASSIHFRLIVQIVDKRSQWIVWSDDADVVLEK